MRGILLVGLFLLTSGCLGAHHPGPIVADPLPDVAARLDTFLPFRLKDPVGDATDTGAGDASTLAGCAAWAVLGDCARAPVAVPTLGTAGPHYDLTEIALEHETRDDVVVSFSVAKLSEGFPELENPEGQVRMHAYSVCWAASADGACDRKVELDVMRHAGQTHAEAKFEIRSRDCNEWSWCSWGVPMDATFGSPATFRFTVPKAYLTADGAPLAVHHLQGQAMWAAEPEAFPAWHPGVTAHLPVYHVHSHGGALSGLNLADVTEPLRAEVKPTPPASSVPTPPAGPLLVGGEGANHGAASPYNHPELDLLWFDLYEEGDDLVALFAVREFQGLPAYDFDYSVAVGIDRLVWEIGYRHEGGARGEGNYYGYAGRCIMEMCQDGEVIEPEVETVFGAPGFIAVRTPLEFLGSPSAGTPTSLFWAMTMYSDHNLYWGEHGGDLYGDVHSVFEIDSLRGGGHPYVFGSGHRAPREAVGHGH